MGFKSVLSTFGGDIKKVFEWVGSAKGQAVVASGEAVVEVVDPGLTGIINLANTYITEALKTEALAAGAAVQNGTGTQKLAAVTAAVTPSVLAYAKSAGLAVPTATEIQSAANGIVSFLNALNGTAAA
jgi:hypothetical protein